MSFHDSLAAKSRSLGFVLLSLASFMWGCGNSGQSQVSFELHAAGTSVDGPIEARNSWQVTVEDAQLAFGPLVLCPGFQAGGLCDVARAEWLDSAVVDALDPSEQPLGRMVGVTGMTRSWMYDYGIVSTLTDDEPLLQAAAQLLEQNSVVVRGIAERSGAKLPFEAKLRIEQSETTERGVPVVRKANSDVFEHDISEDTAALTITFNAADWLTEVDFDALTEGPCVPDTAPPLCVFPSDSQAAQALRNALVVGVRPTFVFTTR